MTFAPDGLYVCCVLHHSSLGWPRICDFAGGEFPATKVRETRERIKALIGDGKFADCRGCSLLMEEVWDKSDYLIDLVNLSHSTLCNIRCSYCYLQRPEAGKSVRWWENEDILTAGKKPYKLIPTFRNMMAEGYLSPNAIINWGGGEPLLLKEFDTLFNLTLDYGVTNSVATNGTVFSGVLAEGLKSGRANIVCSIDAGSATTYKLIKQLDYYEKVWRNLAAYAEYGKVVAKYILIPENSSGKEVLNFVRRASEAGVKEIICDVDVFSPELGKQVALLIASAREEAARLDLNLAVGGCGVVGFPEKEVEKKSRETFSFQSRMEAGFNRIKETLKVKLHGGLELPGGERNLQWRQGLKEEADFWRLWIEKEGLDWPEDFIFRCSPTSELQDYVKAQLTDKKPGAKVRLLDVGAGALTGLGKLWSGREVEIDAVDVLADTFAADLSSCGIIPSVPTVFGEMEELSRLFNRDTFDFIYVCSSLHCSYSPLKALNEMIKVVKPGGSIMFSQVQNEGRRRGYSGIYQWDIVLEDGNLMLGNVACRVDLGAFFGDRVDISCRAEGGWVNFSMKRRGLPC